MFDFHAPRTRLLATLSNLESKRGSNPNRQSRRMGQRVTRCSSCIFQLQILAQSKYSSFGNKIELTTIDKEQTIAFEEGLPDTEWVVFVKTYNGQAEGSHWYVPNVLRCRLLTHLDVTTTPSIQSTQFMAEEKPRNVSKALEEPSAITFTDKISLYIVKMGHSFQMSVPGGGLSS